MGSGYGTTNSAYFSSILAREEPGGPMWALNLMKYRPRAEYPDGRPTALTGAEADDLYVPEGPLAAVGASIVFGGDVIHQLRGDATRWDRVGIVRYPTRRAIIDMNMREDFREKHVHKEAGMAFTIVVASFPEEVLEDPAPADTAGCVLLQLVADPSAPDVAAGVPSTRLARFSVDDVMIGDDRRFGEARFDLLDLAGSEELIARGTESDDTGYAVLVRPFIDELVASVGDATSVT